ncbi:MAG: DUF4238 domain-containing protein [Gemmatimonadetes bacterium]|nr:DUF4238 domain-containing protein [Gemmatimonadota bacterium]
MSVPKRHHYVPQMLLRRFTNARGKLYFFDKRVPEKGVLTSTPKNLFLEKHLYTRYDERGTKDVTLERDFAALEGKANQVIEKIVTAARKGLTPSLTADEKATWDQFFYYQWKRAPDLHEKTSVFGDFENVIQEALAEFETTIRPLTDEERQSMQDRDVLARIKQNAKVDAVADPGQEVQDVLGQKGLGVVIIPKPNKSFVIGSLPIVKLTQPGRTHLADPSVEAWLPIASDVAVTPALSRNREKLVPINEDRHVRGINAAIFKQSTTTAGRSQALITSLANRR